MYNPRRYVDPQDAPPVAYCRLCYGEIYRSDTCYPYSGELVCAQCAEHRFGRPDMAPWTGDDYIEMCRDTFTFKGE